MKKQKKVWGEVAVLGKVVREGPSNTVAFGHRADLTYSLPIAPV